MKAEFPIRYRIDTTAWASPVEGVTLDELVERVTAAGNTVLKVDRDNNRLLLLTISDEGTI